MDLIERLNRSSKQLVSVVDRVPERLLQRSAGDGWSVQQVIEHLYIREQLLGDRIGFFANGADYLPSFDPATVDCSGVMVDGWQRLRQDNIDRLRALPASVWDCETHHPTLDRYSLSREVEIVAAHTEEHVRQVESLLASKPS